MQNNIIFNAVFNGHIEIIRIQSLIFANSSYNKFNSTESDVDVHNNI